MKTTETRDCNLTSLKKEWQAPQCSLKNWKTPRVEPLAFDDTMGGSVVNGAENSTYRVS